MNIKHRIKKRREALKELESLCSSSGNLLIIHYSCEVFMIFQKEELLGSHQ